MFVDGVPGSADADLTAMAGEDTLVVLSDLSDGLMLPTADEPSPLHTSAAIYDFGADSHAVLHLQDGMTWDQTDAGWSYDHV